VIIPLAFDSFGVRSEATFLPKERILIDPGVALGPRRYGLPPSKPELLALKLAKERIAEFGKKAKIVVVTHYHYDHHPYPNDELYEVFKDKIVIAKDIHENINPSGKRRGKLFEEQVKERCKELIYGDGGEYYGIEISPAVWHGPVGSKVGMVVMVRVGKFIHGSDAQALLDPKALEWVIEREPELLIMDGFPTLFLGWKMSSKLFEQAKESMMKAVENSKEVIFDHHGVREEDFKEKNPIFKTGKVKTAAEFLGKENLLLEAWRKKLHQGMKVDVKGYFASLKR